MPIMTPSPLHEAPIGDGELSKTYLELYQEEFFESKSPKCDTMQSMHDFVTKLEFVSAERLGITKTVPLREVVRILLEKGFKNPCGSKELFALSTNPRLVPDIFKFMPGREGVGGFSPACIFPNSFLSNSEDDYVGVYAYGRNQRDHTASLEMDVLPFSEILEEISKKEILFVCWRPDV